VRLQSQLVLQKKCSTTQTAFESSVHRGIVTFGQGPAPSLPCHLPAQYRGYQRRSCRLATSEFPDRHREVSWLVYTLCYSVTAVVGTDVRAGMGDVTTCVYKRIDNDHLQTGSSKEISAAVLTDREDDCTTILSKRREPLTQKHNVTPRRHLQPYRCGNLKYRI
jgi:hypothetical protein